VNRRPIFDAFAELVQDAHAYDWIVFTSPNRVTAFSTSFKLYDDARESGDAYCDHRSATVKQ
jgi:uroporphyrinogen-III synthase